MSGTQRGLGAAGTALLCAVFALSGAAALVFEAVFFRLAGLALGNGVWAVALVLTSFMAGLALGNALAARIGDRVRSPLGLYALLELAIGLTGLGLVVALPWLSLHLAPVFGALADSPVALNLTRLGSGFLLMAVPATAMGMTLPIVVRALTARHPNFGRALGRLYGWNTLGAVVGVLLAERVFIDSFGLRGAALVAAGGNALAAALAVALHFAAGEREPSDGADAPAPGSIEPGSSEPGSSEPGSSELAERVAGAAQRGLAGVRIYAAAFGTGAILLALEVVWFRFFLLFALPHGWNLAVMLAVVLAGIGAGGLLSALWFRVQPDAHRNLAALAAVNGVLVALGYGLAAAGFGLQAADPLERIYLTLAFPVSLVSGVMFTMLGRALHAAGAPDAAAAGRIATANTIGSALGSLLGGFVLLPGLGMERSFFVLAAAYGVVALLLFRGDARGRTLVAFALLALALGSFPFDAMATSILAGPRSGSAMIAGESMRRVAVREGRTETIQYFEKRLLDEPYYYRLVTNCFPMSGTRVSARRYMKLYVYWPLAVRPETKRALLISYGVGMTAKALTDTRSLESIDVVDISRDILEMNAVVYPDPADLPLNDPRVRVHVEDGRFFLQVTDRTFDLITAEPPPPRLAGVVNLYSREYFESIERRLADGGVCTYWLPVSQLKLDEAKSILRAFLDVFPEASLWSGAGLEWMMVGVKGGRAPTEAAFARQWQDPVVAPELRAIGLSEPQQLGALYIADAERLATWIGDVPPLVDDRPGRIASRDVQLEPGEAEEFFRFMNGQELEDSFRRSPLIARLWPPNMKHGALSWFSAQRIVNLAFTQAVRYGVLHAARSDPRLAEFVPTAFFSDAYAGRIVGKLDGVPLEELLARDDVDADVLRHLAARAVQQDRLADGERLLGAAAERSPAHQRTKVIRESFLRIYLRLAADDMPGALALLGEEVHALAGDEPMLREAEAFWSFARDVTPGLPTWARVTGEQ